MTPGRVLCALVVFCVLSIFFFPGINGPYSAVHGPVTALLSFRAAARLRMAIRAGVDAIRIYLNAALVLPLLIALKAAVATDEVALNTPSADSVPVLRC